VIYPSAYLARRLRRDSLIAAQLRLAQPKRVSREGWLGGERFELPTLSVVNEIAMAVKH